MNHNRVFSLLLVAGCAAPLQAASTTVTSATITSGVTEGTRERRDLDVYQLANSLERAGKCQESKAAYAEYGRMVRQTDPASAQMALSYASLCTEHTVPDPALDTVVADVFSHNDADAVAVADRAALAGKTSPWMDYNRAVALADMRRTQEAVEGFKKAEQRFTDSRGRGIAIYGRARALHDAYRCGEAKRAYEEYAALVRPNDPASADMALEYSTQCQLVIIK